MLIDIDRIVESNKVFYFEFISFVDFLPVHVDMVDKLPLIWEDIFTPDISIYKTRPGKLYHMASYKADVDYDVYFVLDDGIYYTLIQNVNTSNDWIHTFRKLLHESNLSVREVMQLSIM